MSVTKKSKHKLRYCPFCGRDPELYENAGFWTVRCCDCGVETWPHQSKHFVRGVWNQREVSRPILVKVPKSSKKQI